MTETEAGRLGHVLYLIEAPDRGSAEVQVLGRLTREGFIIRGLISRSTAFTEDVVTSAA
jgi:hypothetical protein